MTGQTLSILMFILTFCFLLFGFPVAFTLAGISILFAFSASLFDLFNPEAGEVIDLRE